MLARRATLTTLVCALALGAAPTARGEGAESASMEADSLASGRYSTLHARLEKTIFRVRVLELDVRVGRPTAARLAVLLGGKKRTDPLADEAAKVMLLCDDALARLQFLRNVTTGQFLGGVRENLDHALHAGVLTEEQHRFVSGSLPVWFAFLERRGVHKGDTLLYRIHGDTVRTRYFDARGTLLMDRTDHGAAGRLGLIGGYFAPGTDLRDELLRSLF